MPLAGGELDASLEASVFLGKVICVLRRAEV